MKYTIRGRQVNVTKAMHDKAIKKIASSRGF